MNNIVFVNTVNQFLKYPDIKMFQMDLTISIRTNVFRHVLLEIYLIQSNFDVRTDIREGKL